MIMNKKNAWEEEEEHEKEEERKKMEKKIKIPLTIIMNSISFTIMLVLFNNYKRIFICEIITDKSAINWKEFSRSNNFKVDVFISVGEVIST